VIEHLVSKRTDVMAVSRRGQTTADMANGPTQRILPFLETIALLEKLGSKHNHKGSPASSSLNRGRCDNAAAEQSRSVVDGHACVGRPLASR